MTEEDHRILVVDDDDAIRTLLFTVLRRRGFSVDTARDGAAALDHLGHCNYSVILLDLMMPRLNGWEVLDHLATRAPALRPHILVLTASLELRAFPPGLVAGTIHKPFDVDLIVDTVAACITTLHKVEQFDDCPDPEGRPNQARPS
jgi:two-component system response regulator QseB